MDNTSGGDDPGEMEIRALVPSRGNTRKKRSVERLHPGQAVIIQKMDARGAVVFDYPGVVATANATDVTLDATWTRKRMALAYVTFEPGDRFSEWFYTDRWYNIMEVRAQSGMLKGWYCNIGHPAIIADDAVSYRDFILDLWVATDGSTVTLDEDEFAADLTLTTDERAGALFGMESLRAHLARREAPFDALDGAEETGSLA